MTTSATIQKRQDLTDFIERELVSEPAVQAVIGIGSIASGYARPDSDIDAIVFLDPFDPYIVPAEFYWCASDRSFHSIFSENVTGTGCMQLDFCRLPFATWADPSFEWPEERCAELYEGWVAFDRSGDVAKLIAARTAFTDDIRTARLDKALVMLDGHLSEGGAEARWERLGAAIAHDRLQAAYEHLVQALFAYNRQWRPWRDREMPSLLSLPWLPENFEDRILGASVTRSADYAGYLDRAESLRSLFQDITVRLVSDGEYGDDIISEAFIRGHNEPGRAWNMDAWNEKHVQRKA